MFDDKQLTEVLDLHEKSFALLRWVRASLKQGAISFSVVHKASDSVTAAQEWIGRHLANIPAEIRPAEAKVATFSRLFVSFLTTSYRLNSHSARLVSDCGCWCSYCTYLKAGPNLDPRHPSKKDFETARELKRIYLADLAAEQRVAHPTEAIDSVLAQGDLSESVSMATWGSELMRRSQFASQGEAVLALWREFAWRQNSPKRKFKVTARTIIAAEAKLTSALKSAIQP